MMTNVAGGLHRYFLSSFTELVLKVDEIIPDIPFNVKSSYDLNVGISPVSL